ncbi:hypothetical protein BG000_008963 [Podila horticola]|nr:hypothetical protein BG000_008963 [Podila horticola]
MSHEKPASLARLMFHQDLDKMVTNVHTFACGLFPQNRHHFQNDLFGIYEAERYPGRKTITLQDPDDDVYSTVYKAKNLDEKVCALKEVYYAQKEANKQATTQN